MNTGTLLETKKSDTEKISGFPAKIHCDYSANLL